MAMHRALLVALTLSLSGNVALFWWAHSRGEAVSPASKPVPGTAVSSSAPEPVPSPSRPPEPAVADGGDGDARPPSLEPVSAPMPRGLDWCGTGREAYPPLLGPKWRLDEFDDDVTRARMANDEEWNALLIKLRATDLPAERLALMRAFLVAAARRPRRVDVAELAHCLGTLEFRRKAPAAWIVERLYRAASALRRSVTENWLTNLDPPPSSTPSKGD